MSHSNTNPPFKITKGHFNGNTLFQKTNGLQKEKALLIIKAYYQCLLL